MALYSYLAFRVKVGLSVFALATLMLMTVLGGVANAYTYGTTWFSNGSRSMSGPSGSQVKAYATQAVPNTPYRLVSGKNGCTTDIVAINPNTVYAGSTGLVGTVTGTINRSAGTYDVCFYSVRPGAEGFFTTQPVTFVISPSITGTTWFSNGSRSMSGPSGSQVKAYATQAVPNTPYRLVSGKNGCTTDIVAINPNTVYAGSTGLVGTVTGTINRSAGTYDVCFYSVRPGAEGSTISSPVTFIVS